jgi:hypothetical protein
MYIQAIPPSGDASCMAEQSISREPPPRTPVSSAMIAKVGAAAKHSQSAVPRMAAANHSSRVPIVYVGMGLSLLPSGVVG